MKICEHMKATRILHGISQKELSKASGVSISNIQGMENGKHYPNIQTLALICKSIGITVDDYIGTDYKEFKP